MKKEPSQIRWLFQESFGAGKYLLMQGMSGVAMQLAHLLMASYVLVEIVNFLTGEGRVPLSNLVWASVAILVVNLISRLIFDIYGAKASQILWRNSRARIFKAFYTRDFALIQKRHSAELQMLLNNDSSNTTDAFAVLYTHFLADAVIGIGAFILMLSFNWQVAMVMMVALLVLTFFFKKFMSGMQKATTAMQKAEEDVRLNLQEGTTKMLLLKAYGMVNSFLGKFDKLYDTKINTSVNYAKAASLYNITSGLMTFCVYFIIYGLGGYFVYIGSLTIGELVGMATLSHMLSSPVFKLGGHIRMFASASASAKRIREVTELPEEMASSSDISNKINEINASGLYFAYDDEDILKDVNINAKSGEIVGIIGESGSGKSTLTKILMGLYIPKIGDVRLIDQNNRVTDNARNHIAYVPSNDFLFTASVKENICMTNSFAYEQMMSASRAAGIHDFIESLPEKYDTIIGEGLNTLSSGQGQRIAIARALYASKPILIFDEPTSNLDVDSISTFHETVQSIAKDKICLIVTHDLATKDICNKVYTVNDGHVKLENG
ncbi:MAG: ABC transporter ATP-binding protein/permease [Defluviitaleaceae bacterium]|nr:ABC transporter ATP-binding protein/permease [Defluviitaleaceae bacterium]